MTRRERTFIHGFSPQMATMTTSRASPSQSQDPRASARSPIWSSLGHFLLIFQVHKQGSRLQAKQLGISHSDIGYWCCRQWLNSLCHSSNSKKDLLWLVFWNQEIPLAWFLVEVKTDSLCEEQSYSDLGSRDTGTPASSVF